MKKSVFDMNFVLPPLAVMTDVEKNLPAHTGFHDLCSAMKIGDHCF
jgi:hypothetical protein